MNPQVLLEENINLRSQVALLSERDLLLSHQNHMLTQQLQQIKEQLDWLKRQIFGQRSEKIIDHPEQLSLQLEIEHEVATGELQKQTIEAHQRRKQAKGQDTITLPEDIPVDSTILDLPDEQKTCPQTGQPLVRIGEEISRKLAHRPGSYYIKELIRPKYALANNEGVAIQTLPEGILPRCQADESFLAEVFTRKFGDHLPLYRIVEILSREKIIISRQLLSQWVLKCGEALSPLYNELEKQILQSPVLFADETPIDMLMPGKGKTHQGYMWVKVAESGYRLYHFKTNRKHENATEILQGYKGVVHSDKYKAYETLANKKQFTWCPCWAHIRRKFYEAESGDPKLRSYILRKIRYLFMLEKVAWSRSPEERLRIRQEKEVPIIDELIQKAKQRLIEGKLLPKSKMREALGYFLGLTGYVKNYTEHSEAHLDNNTAERAIRPLAIGRKNWLFVGSEAGGRAAAVLLSLVQSCRATGVNPREYLEDVMRRLMDHNAQKLDELLPLAWAASKKSSASQPG
jgi:transposase